MRLTQTELIKKIRKILQGRQYRIFPVIGYGGKIEAYKIHLVGAPSPHEIHALRNIFRGAEVEALGTSYDEELGNNVIVLYLFV